MICNLTGMHVNTMIIYTAMAVKCARYKLPFNIESSDILSFNILTKGWTEHLTHAIPYQMNTEYNEFKPNEKKLCVRHDNYLQFSTRESVLLDKFVK